MLFDFLIVGAGFSGSVAAERLASRGNKILLIDKREHIGGNAFDEYDSNGILIHKYGPHIFHTNSRRIFEYLSTFTTWRNYEHRVLAHVDGRLFPIPINLDTINGLYNLDLDEKALKEFFEKVRIPRSPINTSEDVVLNTVGMDLYEKFFKGYTRKQWGLDPSELSASVTARIPVRTNRDDRYFTDSYQAMPKDGYTKLFSNILDHPNIQIELNVDFFKKRNSYKYKHLIYTGPIDAYYDFKFGPLPYRSLIFEHTHIPNIEYFQKVGTINYPNDYSFTRITEFKHLTGQKFNGTSIVKEYPTAEGDPYYPIPNSSNDILFKKYYSISTSERNVTFIGRLAQYKYFNMDQCVGASLKAIQDIFNEP
ncbi:UDP-galactopyranose mutase [Deltaproteobacteria bacterium PRO3]|nr:UDP-galactopyranose mutase [Deltaproteobacteria bacterium PRO3]